MKKIYSLLARYHDFFDARFFHWCYNVISDNRKEEITCLTRYFL